MRDVSSKKWMAKRAQPVVNDNVGDLYLKGDAAVSAAQPLTAKNKTKFTTYLTRPSLMFLYGFIPVLATRVPSEYRTEAGRVEPSSWLGIEQVECCLYFSPRCCSHQRCPSINP